MNYYSSNDEKKKNYLFTSWRRRLFFVDDTKRFSRWIIDCIIIYVLIVVKIKNLLLIEILIQYETFWQLNLYIQRKYFSLSLLKSRLYRQNFQLLISTSIFLKISISNTIFVIKFMLRTKYFLQKKIRRTTFVSISKQKLFWQIQIFFVNKILIR